MKTVVVTPDRMTLNGVEVQPVQVTVSYPEYQDTGLLHGGTWNARGREADLGKPRADALVRALRLKRKWKAANWRWIRGQYRRKSLMERMRAEARATKLGSLILAGDHLFLRGQRFMRHSTARGRDPLERIVQHVDHFEAGRPVAFKLEFDHDPEPRLFVGRPPVDHFMPLEAPFLRADVFGPTPVTFGGELSDQSAAFLFGFSPPWSKEGGDVEHTRSYEDLSEELVRLREQARLTDQRVQELLNERDELKDDRDRLMKLVVALQAALVALHEKR